MSSCAESMATVLPAIQSTCCAGSNDCDHGTPATCNADCGDLVTDFWGRCAATVAESLGSDVHNQLDAFARICDRTTGAGAGSPPPPTPVPPQECDSLAGTAMAEISRLCCKNRECGVHRISKCSRACADVFVPFFTQCGAQSYPASSIENLAALSQTCIDRHPGTGSGSGH